MNKFNFLRPLTTEEYDALKADIAANGQHYPIVRDQDGVTLDGIHRERITKELGIVPKIETRQFKDDNDRIAFVIASNLHRRQSSAEDRKAAAIRLYQELGLTQQQIASILHIGRGAVQKYLDGLLLGDKPARPKGGRPKSTTKHKYPKELEDQAAKLVLDEGFGVIKTAAKLGVSEQVVIRSTERERGRREVKAAEPVVTRDDLSLTAQQKFDAAVARHQKQLDLQFEERVKAEQLRREDIWLGWELEEFRKAIQRNYNYPGFMSKAQYRDLQRCLHTDTLDGVAKQGTVDPSIRKRFDDSLGLVIKLEAVLVKEDRKLVPRPTMEEMMRRREEVRAKARANAAKGRATKAAKAAATRATP